MQMQSVGTREDHSLGGRISVRYRGHVQVLHVQSLGQHLHTHRFLCYPPKPLCTVKWDLICSTFVCKASENKSFLNNMASIHAQRSSINNIIATYLGSGLSVLLGLKKPMTCTLSEIRGSKLIRVCDKYTCEVSEQNRSAQTMQSTSL